MTSENFMTNAPSARYRVGLVIHNVKPLRNCSTNATQIAGNNRLSEEYEIVSNNPNSRRVMIRMNPITTAVPNAWTVSANGQPHSDSPRVQAENCVFSSHSSTASSSLSYQA